MDRRSTSSTWLAASLLGLATGLGCPATDSRNDDAAGGCRTDDDCRGDRICEQGTCMSADELDEDQSDDDGDGPDLPGGDPSSPGDDGEPPDPGDDGDSSPSGGGDNGGSCSGDATQCEGSSSMSFCEDGQWSTYTCDDFCGGLGFTAGSCSADFCNCGEPLDPVCATGAAALCACLEDTDDWCTDQDVLDLYLECYWGDLPELECVAEYVDGDTIDCSSALEYC